MGIRVKLGISFLAGLFLIGIGCGVAFAEFSSFQMGEETVIGADSLVKEVVIEQIPSDQGEIYVFLYGNQREAAVETDPSLAPDEIAFELEYNKYTVEVDVDVDLETNTFYMNSFYSEFSVFFYMEDFLNSIKAKRIPNYQFQFFGTQTIRVAPENEARIKFIR